ncbi:Zinc/iron permease family-containing protein [Strongyloides ratti]|uniref:Zinc/iron permease family-containing protein n=1 Tax=Strongyloides ratti TaxID=34506 RepID=A0A090KQF5_STRRB|nr:Zinc/iron permease family-containing protein [Strongyloides ratti]CEF59619.1 Zinc/iron permease family-containing protein [Strongyloides ratti]
MLFFILFGAGAFLILATVSLTAFKYASGRLVNNKYVSTPITSPHNQSTFMYFACGVFLGICFLGLLPHALMQEKIINGKINIKNITHGQDLYENNNFKHTSSWFSRLYSTHFLVLLGFTIDLLLHQVVSHFYEKKNSSQMNFKSFIDKSIKYSVTRDFTLSDNPDDDPVEGTWNLEEPSDCLMDDLEGINFRQPFPHGPSCHNLECNDTLNSKSFFEASVFMFALSTHSIFEGMALGAQKNDKLQFTLFYAAVILHEILCVTSFSFVIAKQKIPTKSGCLMIGLLAFCIPLGMILEEVINKFTPTNSPTFTFVLTSICCGIFLYEICVEMLGKDAGTMSGCSSTSTLTNQSYEEIENFHLYKFIYFFSGLGLMTFANLVFGSHLNH